MKRTMIWKNTLREIRGSIGRFLAIFAIVALGVGLFSGLKITKADFLKSMEQYYARQSFYDYRIMGTLGFSGEQVSFLAEQEGVLAAEGAVFFDFYYTDPNGRQSVGRFHSITEKINRIVLVEGRLPETAEEIAVDSMYFQKDSIGKSIFLGEENDQENLSQLREREYRIVGIVKSPLYVQYERGNSSLGSGKVDAFFYLSRESFTTDYDTEIYIKFDRDFPLYSEEYETFMELKEKEWEEISASAGHQRFLELPAVIEKAQEEWNRQREEAFSELEDARRELEEAEAELLDGEMQLADGKEKLEKGREELKEARENLAEAKKTISEKEEELEKGEREAQKAQDELADKEKLILEKETELAEGKKSLEAAELTLSLGEMQQKLTMDGLISEQKSLDAEREKLLQRERSNEALETYVKLIGQEKVYAEQIAAEREAIARESEGLDGKIRELHERYVQCLKLQEEISQGKQEYEASQKAVLEGEKALEDGKAALLQGKRELLEAQKMLASGSRELSEAKEQVRKGEQEISDGEKELSEKEREWEDANLAWEEGRKTFSEGQREYEEGLSEFTEKTEEAWKEILKLKEQFEQGREPEVYLLGRETNIGYVCFENDSAIVDGIANVFPVFFFLVAALVCVTTMNRMVEEQRTQIGVMKALGYSDGRIMFKYLFYSGSAALTGCVLGYAGGTILFPYIIWKVYGIMYQAGAAAFTFSKGLAGLSLLVSLLCSVGATYLSCHMELSGQAAQLMRPKAPKAGKRVFFEKIPFLWKRLSFLRKVAVRNVMRYKKRLLMMVLGIGGCTGLLVTGFGIKDSVAGVAELQFTEIQHQDMSVTLQKTADEEFIAQLERLREKGLEDYLLFQESSMELRAEHSQKNVTVITFPEELAEEKLASYIDMHTPSGEHISKPGAGEAVLTRKAAEQLHLKVGDRIVLRNDSMQETGYVVSGIMQNYVYNYVYLSGDCKPKSFYVRVKPGSNTGRLSTALMKLDTVANVSVTEDVVTRFDKMMSSLNLIVVLVTFCAAGLAFIVLYNLTNINITERIREIATIKVLGFFPRETALYVFRENLFLTALGALAGLGIGKMLHAFVIHEIDVDLVDFAVRIFPKSYCYSVVLTFLFAIMIQLWMNGKLDRISMTESLKSVD